MRSYEQSSDETPSAPYLPHDAQNIVTATGPRDNTYIYYELHPQLTGHTTDGSGISIPQIQYRMRSPLPGDSNAGVHEANSYILRDAVPHDPQLIPLHTALEKALTLDGMRQRGDPELGASPEMHEIGISPHGVVFAREPGHDPTFSEAMPPYCAVRSLVPVGDAMFVTPILGHHANFRYYPADIARFVPDGATANAYSFISLPRIFVDGWDYIAQVALVRYYAATFDETPLQEIGLETA